MIKVPRYLDRPFFRHAAFWLVVLACYLVSNWDNFLVPGGALASDGSRVAVQMFAAYCCLGYLLPRYIKDKRVLPFVVGVLVVAFVGHTVLTMFKHFWLEPSYPYGYRHCLERFRGWSLSERVFNLKYAFFSSPVDVFLPTIVLAALQYYRKQQQMSELNEKRKTAELNALKHQLNPHFLFNTLNNLYSLALKKSDRTPVAIAKLSDILDHILYRCDVPFVSLEQEVALLENYIELEKIRYGDRVTITFNRQIVGVPSIAPLILLTFLENAFKHGVSQETGQAQIQIDLWANELTMDFVIENSIPKYARTSSTKERSIGLANVRQQLALVYGDRHQLDIEQGAELFSLRLRLQYEGAARPNAMHSPNEPQLA